VVFFPRPRDPNFHFSEATVRMYICTGIFLVAFYYLNTQVLIPNLLTKRKWFLYILSILGILFLFLLIPKLFESALLAERSEKARIRFLKWRQPFLYPFTGSTAVFFLVFTVSTCSRVIQEWLGIEKKKQKIETEKLATELSFLRSQINPHFLFNTLNNIYSLALVKSDATANAVLKLSSIMRYVLNETKHDIVPLMQELEFMRHYIELQKIRLTNKVTINFLTEGPIEGKQIAPLILIPFVENAFKYGISTKENSAISFKVKVDETHIYFTSENHIFPSANESREQTGIGLKNTKRRLELLYPGRHTLSVINENSQFIVHLTIVK
jgi:hypothetical protein